MRFSILPFFILLFMPCVAKAQDNSDSAIQTGIQRCVNMRLDETMSERIGFALNRIKTRDIDIGDGPVAIQPRMAGLRGPSVTLLGRDVRLALYAGQTSPQEMWKKSLWNQSDIACGQTNTSWKTSLKRGFYWGGAFDTAISPSSYQPKFMYRSRYVVDAMLVRPYGFSFGGALALPLSTNTESLLYLPDTRKPVRRDIAQFGNSIGLERLYASWRTTPVADLHLAATAGWLEEMYGGFGGEAVYRPFGSAFWLGADGWQVWRRNPATSLNAGWTAQNDFTGHVRLGYDMPDSRFGLSLAAGKYLAGDTGATLKAAQGFENGLRLNASLTWSTRSDLEGIAKNSHLAPLLQLVWPLGGQGGHYKASARMEQTGRDSGQMLDRPAPLETMTEAFSAREVLRHWPHLLD